jgi:hypothetical protein
MSNSSVLLRPFEGYHARSRVAGITEAGRNAVPVIDRLSDHATVRNALLDCYLEGWAEANVVKILAATNPGYRFHDPFVGSFSRWSLHEYFDRVQNRLARSGAIGPQDFGFFLGGLWTHVQANSSSGARRRGSGSPAWPGLKSGN